MESPVDALFLVVIRVILGCAVSGLSLGLYPGRGPRVSWDVGGSCLFRFSGLRSLVGVVTYLCSGPLVQGDWFAQGVFNVFS